MSWTSKIIGAISGLKDAGTSAAIQRWLAREIQDYGQVLEFSIDSKAKSAELHLMLKGENERLTVWIEKYEILKLDGRDFIRVERARASREWVEAVLRNFVIAKPHPIPERYGGIAKLMLGGY